MTGQELYVNGNFPLKSEGYNPLKAKGFFLSKTLNEDISATRRSSMESSTIIETRDRELLENGV